MKEFVQDIFSSEYDKYRECLEVQMFLKSSNIKAYLAAAFLFTFLNFNFYYTRDPELALLFCQSTTLSACFNISVYFFDAHQYQYFGFIISFLGTCVQILNAQTTISLEFNNTGIAFIGFAPFFIFMIQQVQSNWKIKAVYFFGLKTFIIMMLSIRFGGVCSAFISSQAFEVLAGSLVFYDFETRVMIMTKMNLENQQEKLKWERLTNTLPFFMLEYDIVRNKVIKENQYCRSYFHRSGFDFYNLQLLLEEKQTIEIQNQLGKADTLQGACLSDLLKMIIQFPDYNNLNVTLKKWQKDFIIISSPLCEDEYTFLFIDNSLNRKYQLQQLSQRVATVLYQSLTHKFMTPINSLKSILYIIQEKVKDSKILERIGACLESIFTLEQLIQNLNDLSLAQIHKLQVVEEECSISSVIRESFDFFQQQIKLKELNYQLKVDESALCSIITDPKRIKQLLFILIYNAIKYTSVGSVKVEVQCLDLEGQESLEIKVKDSGCGISDEVAENAFKLFNNLEESNEVNKNGIGLGLTIIHEVVHALQGTISILSRAKGGTEFRIQIPIKIIYRMQIQTEEEEIKVTDSLPSPASCKIPKKFTQQLNEERFVVRLHPSKIDNFKVLLVDDDPLNLYALELLFENQELFSCHKAKNGREAIDMIKKEGGYNLIVMDINMPVMNGMEATKELRRLSTNEDINLQGTLIYMHSAIQDTINWRELFDGRLPKPINIEEFHSMVKKVMDS